MSYLSPVLWMFLGAWLVWFFILRLVCWRLGLQSKRAMMMRVVVSAVLGLGTAFLWSVYGGTPSA